MTAPLARWQGPTARTASAGKLACTTCRIELPGPRATDGTVVCADHDAVVCASCAEAEHGRCSREAGLGARLRRNIEARYLLDYMQFAAPMKGNTARWLVDGALRSTPSADRRHVALQVLATYMAATEDLSVLLHALRRRLVDIPCRETLVQTLLDSRESALREFLSTVQTDIELISFVGLEYIRSASLPGIDMNAACEAVARSVFRTTFGSPTEEPNWRPGRWRAYQKLKHGGVAVSDVANVFGVSFLSNGPGVLDTLGDGKSDIPQPISFEIEGKDPAALVELVEQLGFVQQFLVICYMSVHHHEELVASTPERTPGGVWHAPSLRACAEFFRRVAPA